jgi:hypothetical protein
LSKEINAMLLFFLIGARAGAGVPFTCWLFCAALFVGAVQVALRSLFPASADRPRAPIAARQFQNLPFVKRERWET